MIQKIIKVGNSLAVTISSKFIHDVGYKAGDYVYVEENTQHKMLLIKPKTMIHPSGLTPEFFSWLEEITTKYADVIKELAKK